MDIKTEKEITVTLTLNATEALWIKRMVQNATVPPNEEGSKERAMRMRFWNTLPSIEELTLIGYDQHVEKIR